MLGDLAEDLWQGFCLVLSLLGLVIRCLVIGYVPGGTSGRDTKKQKADMLNTTGMYSILRHPLYLGNFFIFLGIVLSIQVWWFALLSMLSFWFYYEKIIFAEEEFLRRKFGGEYLKWAKKTPAFLPKFKHWQTPNLAFSFKTVFRKEHSAFFVITTSFSLLDITQDSFMENKLKLDLGWLIVFVCGLAIYLTLLTLKRKTKILNVEGR